MASRLVRQVDRLRKNAERLRRLADKAVKIADKAEAEFRSVRSAAGFETSLEGLPPADPNPPPVHLFDGDGHRICGSTDGGATYQKDAVTCAACLVYIPENGGS